MHSSYFNNAQTRSTYVQNVVASLQYDIRNEPAFAMFVAPMNTLSVGEVQRLRGTFPSNVRHHSGVKRSDLIEAVNAHPFALMLPHISASSFCTIVNEDKYEKSLEQFYKWIDSAKIKLEDDADLTFIVGLRTHSISISYKDRKAFTEGEEKKSKKKAG